MLVLLHYGAYGFGIFLRLRHYYVPRVRGKYKRLIYIPNPTPNTKQGLHQPAKLNVPHL